MWKFMELMEHYKYYHNMQVKRLVYATEKEEEKEQKQAVYF